MEIQTKNQGEQQQGKGYLIGALIGISAGILMFVFTKVFVLSIAMALPLTISIGMGLEEKYKGVQNVSNASFRKTLVGLLVTGVFAFVAFLLYFILHS